MSFRTRNKVTRDVNKQLEDANDSPVCAHQARRECVSVWVSFCHAEEQQRSGEHVGAQVEDSGYCVSSPPDLGKQSPVCEFETFLKQI